MHEIEVKIAALGLKVARGCVEVGRQVAGSGQHGLPESQVGRVGRELLQTVKEVSDIGADAGTAAPKLCLNLLQVPEFGAELALLLGFLMQLNFEDGVAQAFDFLQKYSGAKAQCRDKNRVARHRCRNLAGVSGGICVGHTVSTDCQLLLADSTRSQFTQHR